MPSWFMWFIIFWSIFLITVIAIGGYFGKSELDWQEYYIKETLHLWKDEQKQLLNELVAPVPELFRDAAKGKIAGKIGELALKDQITELTEDYIIRGYILATPKRDHKFLIRHLQKKNIDITPYQHLLEKE